MLFQQPQMLSRALQCQSVNELPNIYNSERLHVIPSEAEESKPAVISNGVNHTTRPRIEARSSPMAWLKENVLRFLGFARNDSRVGR